MSEQQQDAGAAAPAKSAKPTVYDVGLDAGSINRIVEWAEQHYGDGFNDPFPAGLGARDIVYIGGEKGGTRAQAVNTLLDRDAGPQTAGQSRLCVVKDAEQEGIELLFMVVPANYIGEIPVQTKVERRRRVGK